MNIKIKKEKIDCNRCGGTGEVFYWDKNGNKRSKKCSKCKGSGIIYIDGGNK